MEAPKCKLCGERHYGLCRGREEVVPNHREQPQHNAMAPVKAGAKPGRKLKSEFVDNAGYFDRTAYMRGYMARKRAAPKEPK